MDQSDVTRMHLLGNKDRFFEVDALDKGTPASVHCFELCPFFGGQAEDELGRTVVG